jgi:hypothetical protein
MASELRVLSLRDLALLRLELLTQEQRCNNATDAEVRQDWDAWRKRADK